MIEEDWSIEWNERVEIVKFNTEFLTAGEVCKAIFWPTVEWKVNPFDSSRISAPNVPFSRGNLSTCSFSGTFFERRRCRAWSVARRLCCLFYLSPNIKSSKECYLLRIRLILVLPMPDSAGQNCPEFSVVLVFFNYRRCWWKPGNQVLLPELVCPLCGSSRRCPHSVCWETTGTRTVAGHSVAVRTKISK